MVQVNFCRPTKMGNSCDYFIIVFNFKIFFTLHSDEISLFSVNEYLQSEAIFLRYMLLALLSCLLKYNLQNHLTTTLVDPYLDSFDAIGSGFIHLISKTFIMK